MVLLFDTRSRRATASRVSSGGPAASDSGAVRLGLRMLAGLPQSQAVRIEQARTAGAYRSIADFTCRSGVAPKVVERLARADAFGSLALGRRASLWQALGQEKKNGNRPLLEGLNDGEPRMELPAMSGQQEVFADYRTAGLSLKAHPVSFFRAELDALGVESAARLAELTDGTFVRVAGLVLVRQRPGTAKGITFVTLEDETGTANLIVRMEVWERFYQVARTAPGFIAHGRLQKHKEIIHVLVSKLENLSNALRETRLSSRDFH